MSKRNSGTVTTARSLRKNMTRQERKLWYEFLSTYPIRFRRQEIFDRYIADFYCAQAKLVLELDGSQHFSDEGIAYDAQRTQVLQQFGVTVVRIPNNQVDQNFHGVCTYIDDLVKQRIKKD